MKHWKHINFEQRKIIKQYLSRNAKLKDIASVLGYDGAAIRKEIKRNRYQYHDGIIGIDKDCKKLNRFPYCCDGCVKRYKGCGKPKYSYSPQTANDKALKRLVTSRSGIDISEKEFDYLDEIVSTGIKEKKSPYTIKMENPKIKQSVSTLYRYIDKGIMSVKRIDLQLAVKYKVRKKDRKKYDYSNSYIDRSGRTFLDYLNWRFSNQSAFVCQMDFPGSKASDSTYILTLSFTEIHFVILKLLRKPTSQKIVGVFNQLENTLGLEVFQRLFSCILTDRDPLFADYKGIESTMENTGELRTRIFYCDAYRSTQKANVENMNRQIRIFIPKGSSVDTLNENDVHSIQKNLNERHLASLAGRSPKEVFVNLFGIDIYNKLK